MSEQARPAARWLDSGWMDVEFYSALRGIEFEDAPSAVRDFVDTGMVRRLSPHPDLVFGDQTAEIRSAWRRGKVRRVLALLADVPPDRTSLGPVETKDRRRARLLEVAARLGREEAHPAGDAPPPAVVGAVVGAGRADAASVVMVTRSGLATIRRSVSAVLATSERHATDLELLVVDNGSPAHVALALESLCGGQERVRIQRFARRVPFAAAANAGLAIATGSVVVFLADDTEVRGRWLEPLVESLSDADVAGAQPLLLAEDDTIECAGLGALAPSRPLTPLLGGHPPEDAERLRHHPLPAVSGRALVARREDLDAVHGFDERCDADLGPLDLCRRLLDRRPGGFRVVPDSWATSLTTPPPVGDRADALAEGSPPPTLTSDQHWLAPDPELARRLDVARDPGGLSLRWSLRLPSTPGRWGDDWGDTHFAAALARSLRGLGQDVVSRRRGAHSTGPLDLDDVSLALRGAHPVDPVAGQVNVLWVISHPDQVTPSEVDGFDLVFAASVVWSELMTKRSGRAVIPLLQATDFPEVPRPVGHRSGTAVFVGNNPEDRERPLVWMAIEAGIDVAVYGRGWEGLPPGVWRGEYVANAHLPELYRRHGVVLADHWPDMAGQGFVANRVFDALASGARVLCDDVRGLAELFPEPEVIVCRSPEELRAGMRASTPAAPARAVSLGFDDRARQLLEAVSALR